MTNVVSLTIMIQGFIIRHQGHEPCVLCCIILPKLKPKYSRAFEQLEGIALQAKETTIDHIGHISTSRDQYDDKDKLTAQMWSLQGFLSVTRSLKGNCALNCTLDCASNLSNC
jgi:hypothetical protein